ncbi:MAG: hypothetical protein L3J09_01905 [Flavobacteriaceae bacterium]|nr:hypothetical protein [Flavobacteriaceae bacterium]
MNTQKNKLLKKGILLDAIGMATMLIPVAGTIIDLLWAPYAAKKMTEMYPGKKGKIASVIVFLEELIPGLDFIPTFTLMWLYTFVWGKQPKMQPITVEVKD